MIRILQAAHPGVLIDNEIIEPNPQHVAAYKGEMPRPPPPAWGRLSTHDLSDKFACCSVKLMFFFHCLKQSW